MTVVDNNQDVLDSRDVIARIEELEAEREELVGAVGTAQWILDGRKERLECEGDPVDVEEEQRCLDDANGELADWDNSDELRILKELAEEGEGCSDWADGATLIRDSYFEDYARELAEELDLIPSDSQWPSTCIDWAQAASELQMDYTSIEFDGVTYWVR